MQLVIIGVNGMAYHLKKQATPMKEITIPKKLLPLIKAFSVDEKSSELLILEAAKAINKATSKGYCLSRDEPSKEEIAGIIALMKGIAPRDTIEMIYGAQIISSHLMGLSLLSHDFAADQVLGLKLLRFSNEAMSQLQKKRSGGISQNINITYNYIEPRSALMQTETSEDISCQ